MQTAGQAKTLLWLFVRLPKSLLKSLGTVLTLVPCLCQLSVEDKGLLLFGKEQPEPPLAFSLGCRSSPRD